MSQDEILPSPEGSVVAPALTVNKIFVAEEVFVVTRKCKFAQSAVFVLARDRSYGFCFIRVGENLIVLDNVGGEVSRRTLGLPLDPAVLKSALETADTLEEFKSIIERDFDGCKLEQRETLSIVANYLPRLHKARMVDYLTDDPRLVETKDIVGDNQGIQKLRISPNGNPAELGKELLDYADAFVGHMGEVFEKFLGISVDAVTLNPGARNNIEIEVLVEALALQEPHRSSATSSLASPKTAQP